MKWRSVPGTLACWLFAASLALAPWPFGATPGWAVRGLELLLTATFLLWAIDVALRPRALVFHPALPILGGVLLVLGWGKVLSAPGISDSASGLFFPVASRFAFSFGAVDLSLAREGMALATCLIGAVLCASDLAANRDWQLRVWIVMAGTGALIALLGLVQKAAGAPGIYWSANVTSQTTFFSSFVYHANAGAFLNLCLPLSAGLLIRSFRRPRNSISRSVWIASTTLTVAACAVNTSRGSQVVAVMITAALLCWPARRLLVTLWHRRELRQFGYPVAAGALLVGVVAMIGWQQSFLRWASLIQKPGEGIGSRLHPLLAGIAAARQAGWTGFGPGCFQAVFPYFTGAFGDELRGYWVHLHNDYAQTVIEWGFLGAAMWGFLFFGGLGVSLIRLARLNRLWRLRQKLLASCCVIALGGVAIHSLYDFPLQIASIQLYTATLLGVSWGTWNWTGEESRSRKNQRDHPQSDEPE